MSWRLYPVEHSPRPLTRPPSCTLSLWDIRRARFTSPRYGGSIPPLLSPLKASPVSFTSTGTQMTTHQATVGTQTTQSDSEWEPSQPTSVSKNIEPPTPPSSPEGSYTPPPVVIPERSYTPPLPPPQQLKWTTTAPSISWTPKY